MSFRNRVLLICSAIALAGVFPVFAQVADPVLSVTGVNNSTQTVTVTISDSTSGATIYYSTNGQTPNTAIASGSALTFSQSATLKVQTTLGSQSSDLVTANYTDLGLVSSSGDHTVVLNKDGTISSWGNGTSGQLGRGNLTSSNLPVQTQISSGTAFTGAYPARGLVTTTQVALGSLPVTSGLTAWYRADAGVSASSGTVTQWNDQTSNGYNVTPATDAAAPTSGTDPGTGKPVVSFNGNQLLQTGSQITGLDNATVIAIAGSNAPAQGTQTLITLGSLFNDNGARMFGYDGGQDFFNNSSGNNDGGLPVPADSLLHLSATTFAEPTGTLTNGTAYFYNNGVANGSASVSDTTALGPALTIGSMAYSVDAPWNGNIAEIIVYNRVLSATELQQVQLYLATKYGVYMPGASWINSYTPAVQSEINRNSWNQSQADAYVAFQNANSGMLTNGLRLWLRADAGVTTGIGSYVAGWADQTGNYTLNQTAAYGQPLRVTNSTGQYALQFNGSQSLGTTSGISLNADMTVIEVGTTTTSSSALQYSFYLGNGTSGESRAIGYNSAEQYFDTTGSNGFGAAAASSGQLVIEGASLNSSLNTVTFYRNGQQTQTRTVSGVQGTSSGLTVGSGPGGTSAYWQGNICEILVYDHQLSSAEMQQLSLYLANKYGIYYPGASWVAGYSSAVQTQINANQWNESQANQYVQIANVLPVASGIISWYKPDSSLITNSQGQVTSWLDSGMAGNNVTQTSASARPTISTDPATGTPTVAFTTSQSLTQNSGFPNVTSSSVADSTIIAVASTSAASSMSFTPLVQYGTSNNNLSLTSLLYHFASGHLNQMFFDGNSIYTQGGTISSATNLVTSAVTYTHSSRALAFYLNGTANGTGTAGGTGQFSENVSLGGLLGGTAWQGNISEVLIYNRVLSATEIQNIQTYINAKYPSASAPTISVSGTNASTPRTVTLSGATPPAVILYTLDGTTPNASSPQYSTPFNLTQDGVIVKCAIFSSGAQVSQVATSQVWVGDTYGIGVTDAWQTQYLGTVSDLNPNASTPGGSGLTYLQAFQWGYDPTKFSTNGDGLSDSVNHQLGYAGSNTDINGYTDGSGNPMTNAQQLALGLDPFDAGVNPAQPTPPTPDPNDHTPPPVNLTQPSNAILLP